jgi:hypothetical protein
LVNNQIKYKSNEFRNKKFYNFKIFFLKLKLKLNILKDFSRKCKLFKLNSAAGKLLTREKNKFVNILRKVIDHKFKVTKSNNFYVRNLLSKTITSLNHIVFIINQKKEKYIISLINFRTSFIKKVFKSLVLNKIIQKEKNSKYFELHNERERIICSYVFKNLFTNCSREIKKKEEDIANVFIKRSSRGIQTALIWYKRLKSKVELKRLGINQNINREKIIVKINQTYLNSNFMNPESQKTDVKEDINILLNLKNKKRAIAKKIDI